MSKLYSIYLTKKKQNKDAIILFKSGIFYLALNKDATFLSNAFGFKLTNLNNEIKKCGFPCSSLDKYLKLFNAYNLSVSIIDTERNTNYTIKDFEINRNIQNALELIKNINIDTLSVLEAYDFIEHLQKRVKDIDL